MEWVFQSLKDQWSHGRFDSEALALRDISGRVELKGIGYVDIAVYKLGLLKWIKNKKMDDYPAWPAEQRVTITKCWASHEKFREHCGYSPDPKCKCRSRYDLVGHSAKKLGKATCLRGGRTMLDITCMNLIMFSQKHIFGLVVNIPA